MWELNLKQQVTAHSTLKATLFYEFLLWDEFITNQYNIGSTYKKEIFSTHQYLKYKQNYIVK